MPRSSYRRVIKRVRLVLDPENGVGHFHKLDRMNQWRKFHTLSDTVVAEEVAGMLDELGHIVEVVEWPVELAEESGL